MPPVTGNGSDATPQKSSRRRVVLLLIWIAMLSGVFIIRAASPPNPSRFQIPVSEVIKVLLELSAFAIAGIGLLATAARILYKRAWSWWAHQVLLAFMTALLLFTAVYVEWDEIRADRGGWVRVEPSLLFAAYAWSKLKWQWGQSLYLPLWAYVVTVLIMIIAPAIDGAVRRYRT